MRSKFKQDPLSGLIAHIMSLAISLHFHGCLRFQKFLANGLKSFLSNGQHVVDNIKIRGPYYVLRKVERLATKGDLIWSDSCGRILGSVM